MSSTTATDQVKNNSKTEETVPKTDSKPETKTLSTETSMLTLAKPTPAPLVKLPENRPIAKAEIQIRGTFSSSGIRPIGSSALVYNLEYALMGNRPIASNFSEETEQIIGYLD